MKDTDRQRYDRRLRLARSLGPAMVERGVFQRFVISPVKPMEPLRPREIADAWQRLAGEIRGARAPELLSLYVHIPFCAHRCRYCVYYSVESTGKDQVAAYVRRLHKEIDYYADRLSNVGFSNCYIGGGTPTVLEEGPLETLLSHLDRAFSRKRGGEWSFECNPATVTEAKAELFADHGFNRVSFGVQSLSEKVLAGVGRGYQTRRHVVETFRIMKRHNFWINVDLMHGLPGQTASSLLRSLEALLALEPTQVTIYALSPYTPTGVALEDREPLAQLVDRIDAIGRPLGFRSYVGSTFLGLARDDSQPPDGAGLPRGRKDLLSVEHARYGGGCNYDDTTVEPFSLLGLGPTARSYVYGQLRYMHDRIPVDAPWAPDVAQATGRAVDMDEERRRYVVDGLERKDGVVRQEYEARFGAPLEDHFGEALRCGVERGLLDPAQDRIRIACSEPEMRFTAALLFVDDATVDIALDPKPTAAPHRSRPQGSGQGQGRETGSEGPFALALRAHDQEVVVHLADHFPGRRSYHHCGDYAFFLPSGQPEVSCNADIGNARLLLTFTRVFDRVVTRESPQDLAELRRRLLARFGR